MAAPSFVKAGLGEAKTVATSTSLGFGDFPAAVGNMMLFVILQDGTGANITKDASGANINALDGTANDLTQIGAGPFTVGNPAAAKLYLYLGRATTTGASPAKLFTSSSGDDLYYQVFEFTGVHAGTALSDVIENTSAGSTTTGAATSTSVADSEVVTTGADRLAINVIGVNDDNNLELTSMTGETGGDWTYPATAFGSSTGTDGAVAIVTATIASAGTINGGTDTITSDAWVTVGFAFKPAAGGTPHTASPSDSISLTDARAHGRGLGRADTLALTDLLARVSVSFRTVPDTVVLSDATSRAKTIPLAINDTVSLTDSATPAKTKTVAVDDSVALTDAVAKARGLGRADTVALTDAVAKQRGLTRTDTVVIADARSLGQGQAVTDTVALTDAVAKARGVKPADTVTLADAIAKARGLGLADAAVLTDARAHGRTRTVTDSVALTDNATPDLGTGAIDYEVNPDDTVALADARAISQGQAVADSVSLTDNLSRVHVAARSVPDTVVLTDARAFARGKTVADTLSLTDNASPNLSTGSQDHTVDIDDTVALTDQVARSFGLVRADAVALTDSLAATKGATVTVSDSLLVSDLFARAASYVRQPADTLEVVDVLGRTTVTLRTVADLVAITDLVETEVNLVTLLDAIITGRFGNTTHGGVGRGEGWISDTVGGLAAPRSQQPTSGRVADTVAGMVEEEVTV